MKQRECAIPVNVITGFLGVGKTTAIRHLLDTKPRSEKWAVLVNEFGEIGLDASLLAGKGPEKEEGVFIREVPGGCMCCASGLPMQIALNQLITRSQPDRLIIEPTGLGHPLEVLNALSHSSYQGVLDVKATLTLVDARKVSDTRYTEHETFKQQLQIADIIIANKNDLSDSDDLTSLNLYLKNLNLGDVPFFSISQGRINLDWLMVASRTAVSANKSHKHHSQESEVLTQGIIDFPVEGFIRKDNSGEGYKSSGWVFEPRFIFDRTKLLILFSGLDVERLKGVFITEQGGISFNQSDGSLSYFDVGETLDSRIEVIGQHAQAWQDLEEQILQAVIES